MPWGATERIIRKIDATDPADLTLAEIECRKMVMKEVDRLRAEVPQFRNAHLCDIATQLGITESRRLVGEYVLRREDMDRPIDDAIGITGHWTRYGARYWIPYRSLLVRELDNLLAAGPLHLRRPPHPPRHQGDPGLHGHRPGRGHGGGAGGAGGHRRRSRSMSPRCRTPCAGPARSCSWRAAG